MEYLGAWGTLIHEKKTEIENLVSDSLLQLVHLPPPCFPSTKRHSPRLTRVTESLASLAAENSNISLYINGLLGP